jgi:hypothetical protein
LHRDFWLNSGYHLLDHDNSGRLVVTDDFLRAYFLRPEIRPMENSSQAEFDLHAILMESPRMAVSDAMLGVIDDTDVRENYQVLLAFRARLLESDSLESCYAGIFFGGDVTVPPLLIDQLAHIILRSVLDGCDEPLKLRTAELFFRRQRATVQNGAVMLADSDVVESHVSGGRFGSIGRLMAEAKTPLTSVSLDVLERENANLYWDRDQRHDFVVRINHGTKAAKCFCEVIEQWISHFYQVQVKVQTVNAIEGINWSWHIGLDSESTSLLNDLWKGMQVEAGRLTRLLCLYKLEFANFSDMRSDVAGRPVYMALCMDGNGIVRIKPQNLLTNLPISAGH